MMRRRPATACPDFLDDFSDFVDGTLSRERMVAIVAHLDCCEACLRHLSAYRRGIAALWENGSPDVEHEAFWAELERRLWTGGGLAGGFEDGPAVRRSRLARHPAVAVAAAAAFAAVVLLAGIWGDGAFRRAGIANLASGGSGGTTPVSRASLAPRVLPSEPIPVPVAADGTVAPVEPVAERVQPRRTPARPTPRVDAAEAADRAYVAELQREFDRLQQRMRDGDWVPQPAVSMDGWARAVRLGAAGSSGGGATTRGPGPDVRVVPAATLSPWPAEAAARLP